jgi:hypothetical protein
VYRESGALYEGTVYACHPDQFRREIKVLREMQRGRTQHCGKY